MIVLQVVGMVVVVVVTVGYDHTLVWQIDPIDLTDEDFDTAEQLAQRIDNVRDLQIAGSDFVQQRREQEKVKRARAKLDTLRTV